jgi:hypothetical protein
MNLNQIAFVLGGACAAFHVWPLINPEACGQFLRRFARNIPAGIFLTLAATAWFEYNLNTSDISDFNEWKPIMLGALGLVGVGACFYVQDYIAVRGGAAVALLVADVVLEAAKTHPSWWRDVITGWMYLWIAVAMWVVVQPWRVRDWLNWCTDGASRLRRLASVGFLFGIFVIALGASVLR